MNLNKYSTPFYIFKREVLQRNLEDYQKYLPLKTEICYSLKANAEKVVLRILNDAGSSFEASSKYELDLLKKLEVPAQKIIFGSSVKLAAHIESFADYGVDRYAFDSEEELVKIHRSAPKSRVYVRAHVDDQANSVFHMSRKFGTTLREATRLLILAKKLGLTPYGISFNVGSQARNFSAWGRGIASIGPTLRTLQTKGIKVATINIGGGFPYSYKNETNPTIEKISHGINQALTTLPYRVNLLVEPGRGLVANTFDLVVSVFEKIKRPNGHWLYVDAGTYNGALETMAFQGSICYQIVPLKKYASGDMENFIVTGPTCDDLDVLDEKAALPTNIQVGDRLVVRNIGAYSFTLTTPFNGFPRPKVLESTSERLAQ